MWMPPSLPQNSCIPHNGGGCAIECSFRGSDNKDSGIFGPILGSSDLWKLPHGYLKVKTCLDALGVQGVGFEASALDPKK